MKTRKRPITTMVCTVLLAGLLAGCGGNNPSGANATEAPKSGDAQSQSDNSAQGSKGDAGQSGGEVAALDPVTLHIYLFGDKKAAADEVWAAIGEKYKDKLNTTFDVQFIAGDDYKQKMVVKIASGDEWDLNFDGDWLSYYQVITKDGYMGLNELLPKYAPDLYAAYQESGALEAATYRGNITALPWTMVMNNRTFFQWRGDLVEAKGLGVDVNSITTIEAVDELVTKLKSAFPDKKILENADKSAFLLRENLWEIAHSYVFDLTDAGCKVIPLEETQAYRDRAKYAKKWQDADIIWKDVLTDKTDRNEMINQGILITKWGTHEFANTARAWVEAGARWDAHDLYTDKKFANRTPLANVMCIPDTAQNPERALMFLNLVQTDKELYDMVHYGIEGKTYVLNGEEAAYPEGMNASTSNYMDWGGRWALWKPQFMRPDAMFSMGFWQKEQEYAKSNPNNVNNPLNGFSFDVDPVKTEVVQRDQIFDDAEKLINVGLAGDADQAVDKLVSDLKTAGTERITAELQTQVDAYLASKK